MSIFGVAPRRVGGVETFARELSRQLGECGRGSVLCFLAEPSEVVRRFLRLPNVMIEVLEGSVRPKYKALEHTAHLLRTYRPEVLHLYFTEFVTAYPWLARLFAVRRTYLTDQTSRPEAYVPGRAAWWKRMAGRALNLPLARVLAISEYNARCCVSYGLIAPDRVSRLYNAVDLSHPTGDGVWLRGKYGIPEDRPIVLQVSSITPEKGIPDLLEAAKLVIAQNPDVHFVIAGDGPRLEAYKDQARQTGVDRHLTWTGLVEDPLAAGVYSAATVVCQLSRWEEAFGWVIAEAMACGKPVVATRVGGIPELVEDGRSGFLVERRQPNEIAGKILVLLADPGLRDRMGAAGRRAVELRFNLERNVAELLKLYGFQH